MKKITLLFLFAITITNAQSKKTNTYSDEYIKFSYPKTWKISPKKNSSDNLVILYAKKSHNSIYKIPTTKISFYKTLKSDYISIDEYMNNRL
ncbi:hypothetical protein [uncultured Lutibacter sp.]|uniref:hypothetical protein n=1 Tax=uncultured Lutibacter sp. TaxID=437739 RepID=UPI00260D24F6|nr:hypothetical protein [uncultured Lutibacter sp.]